MEIQRNNQNQNNSNINVSPTSGRSFRYQNLRDSFKHDKKNDDVLVDLKSFWEPKFKHMDEIINMEYFDPSHCMSYDDYADMQQRQKKEDGGHRDDDVNDGRIIYGTKNYGENSMKERTESNISRLSERSSIASDVSFDDDDTNKTSNSRKQPGKQIQISINGLTNNMKANPLMVSQNKNMKIIMQTPIQTKNRDSNNDDDDDDDNRTANKQSPTTIEVQKEIEKHLKETSNISSTARKKIPKNYLLSSNDQDNYYSENFSSSSSSSSSSSDADDYYDDDVTNQQTKRHIMLAKQLAKTTKMTSLISNAVYNRNIQLDEMEKEEGGGGP